MSGSSQPRSASHRAAAKAPATFEPAFRARLRDLLLWRRDVRRFRGDPLPSGALDALIELACLAPSVGLSQPWRFVIVDDAARRAAIQRNFETCNAAALGAQHGERAGLYARLKLAGLKEAPCHLAVFADRATAQGHGLGRHTMPEMIEYSAVTHPLPEPRSHRGTSSSTDAVHSTTVSPKLTSTEPAAIFVKSRTKERGRASLGWRPSARSGDM